MPSAAQPVFPVTCLNALATPHAIAGARMQLGLYSFPADLLPPPASILSNLVSVAVRRTQFSAVLFDHMSHLFFGRSLLRWPESVLRRSKLRRFYTYIAYMKYTAVRGWCKQCYCRTRHRASQINGSSRPSSPPVSATRAKFARCCSLPHHHHHAETLSAILIIDCRTVWKNI